MAVQQHFIYLIRPYRPGLVDSPTPQEEAIIEEHFAYLQAALQSGRLVLAGPCLDGAFGVVVFRAASPEAALEFMQGDPVVRAGVMSAEIHPFRVSLGPGRPPPKPHGG